VNRIRCDDQRPHVYRTHDGGKTWKEVVSGLPNDPVNAVREDPVRRGLLFAGTERAVHVSFDDGESWQPLRLNMPATSVRDLVIQRDDVVVGTHGRSFWILDDISPLRQLSADVTAAPAHLFKPQLAYRYRRNTNTDTPLPPEEPAGKNPSDGAILYYHLKTKPAGPVTLEIYGDGNRLVRRYSSADRPRPVTEGELDVPLYWIRPAQVPSVEAGAHRFVWDLHYTPTEAGPRRRDYPISAIYGDTPPAPTGPLAHAGQKLRADLRGRGEQAKEAALKDATAALERKLAARQGPESGGRGGRGGRGGEAREPTFGRVQSEMGQLLHLLQGADATPTSQVVASCGEAQKTLSGLLERWRELSGKELQALNEKLREAKLPPITLEGEAKGR
jgi:hypothetical protein